MKAMVLGVLFFGLFSTNTYADEEDFSVKTEVDKASLTVGERVEYRIAIAHDPSYQILSKIVPPPSEIFEVKEVHDIFEKQGKQIVEGRRFVLATYELGEFILDPVILRYRTPTGDEKTVETSRIYLTVRSVDPSGTPKTDIRGPKGPLELPYRWAWLWGTLGFMAVAAGGTLLWLRTKKKPLSEAGPEEPILSAEEEALLRLNRLFDSDLLRQGKLKEYFLQLSEILRRYFERRYGILAIESTTTEILQGLREGEIQTALREKIRQVLDSSDLVKFAKWKPVPSEILKITRLAKAVVEESRPETPHSAVAPS